VCVCVRAHVRCGYTQAVTNSTISQSPKMPLLRSYRVLLASPFASNGAACRLDIHLVVTAAQQYPRHQSPRCPSSRTLCQILASCVMVHGSGPDPDAVQRRQLAPFVVELYCVIDLYLCKFSAINLLALGLHSICT
jgi:hypothetical protein